MDKSYPISAYIECIKKLGIPYPVFGLKGFLSAYTEKFTRRTNPDNILFDGGSEVTISTVTNALMSSDNIHDMLMGLINHHGPKSDIVTRYKFASTQLSKRHDPRDVPKEEIVLTRKDPATPPQGGHLNVIPRTPAPTAIGLRASLSQDDKDVLEDFIERANENAAEIGSGIPKMKENDALEIIAATNLTLSDVIGESDGAEFLADVWLDYHDSIVIMELATWPFVFFPDGFEGVGTDDPTKLLRAISTKLRKIKIIKDGPKPPPSPSPKTATSKRSQIDRILKAKREALVATLQNPVIKDNVRGMFSSLLATHNTTIDVALNMFLGKYGYIRGVEKRGDHVFPSGRGAQFRWGVDSQYGDVIFIMKPEFWKRYTKGVIEEGSYGPRITDGVIFTNIWNGRQRTEDAGAKELASTLNKEALNFGFREPKVVDLNHCHSPEDVINLTWCNTQIHIGENVSFDDIDVVLIPKYLQGWATVPIEFQDVDISDILFDAQHNKTINGNPNPFYQKFIEYGPLSDLVPGAGVPHPHYSIVLKETRRKRDPIYDKLLKGYTVADVASSKEEEPAIKGALHRSRYGGNSSMIGLSKIAFIDAQEQYMYRLLEHHR